MQSIFSAVYVTTVMLAMLMALPAVEAKVSKASFQLEVKRKAASSEVWSTIGDGQFHWVKDINDSNQRWSVKTKLNADLKLPCHRNQNSCRLANANFTNLYELMQAIGCDLHFFELNKQTSSGKVHSEITLAWGPGEQCRVSHYADRQSSSAPLRTNLRFLDEGTRNIHTRLPESKQSLLDIFPVEIANRNFGNHLSAPRTPWVPVLQFFDINGISAARIFFQPDKITITSGNAQQTSFEYYFDDSTESRIPLSWGIRTNSGDLFFVSEMHQPSDQASEQQAYGELSQEDGELTPRASSASLSSSSSGNPETPNIATSGEPLSYFSSLAAPAFNILFKCVIKLAVKYAWTGKLTASVKSSLVDIPFHLLFLLAQ